MTFKIKILQFYMTKVNPKRKKKKKKKKLANKQNLIFLFGTYLNLTSYLFLSKKIKVFK